MKDIIEMIFYLVLALGQWVLVYLMYMDKIKWNL